jgi:hypothetical protein|eukprot:COSAG01_NODE_12617_length_1710_cov_7.537554_2_plen_153_part_00
MTIERSGLCVRAQHRLSLSSWQSIQVWTALRLYFCTRMAILTPSRIDARMRVSTNSCTYERMPCGAARTLRPLVEHPARGALASSRPASSGTQLWLATSLPPACMLCVTTTAWLGPLSLSLRCGKTYRLACNRAVPFRTITPRPDRSCTVKK